MASTASSFGMIPEMMKKAVCMIMLMRLPSPISSASVMASMM
jgi:hypothetical protein